MIKFKILYIDDVCGFNLKWMIGEFVYFGLELERYIIINVISKSRDSIKCLRMDVDRLRIHVYIDGI